MTDAQRRRLFAMAVGSRDKPGALAGSRRERLNQLNELLRRHGYDWDSIDEATPSYWLNQSAYDELIEELDVIRGGRL